MLRFILIIIAIQLANSVCSQQLELPLDSFNRITYFNKEELKKVPKDDVFNFVIRWIYSKQRMKEPLIRNDTISFINILPLFRVDFEGRERVGNITGNVKVIIKDNNYKIYITDFHYIDFENKDTVAVEDIYNKKVYNNRYYCIKQIDLYANQLIVGLSLFCQNEMSKELNLIKFKSSRSAGDELILASKFLHIGYILLLGGPVLTIAGLDTSPEVFLGGLAVTSLGLLFTIKTTIHIKRAGIILNNNEIKKETSLIFNVSPNRIGISYQF